jgi:hypothetical protein
VFVVLACSTDVPAESTTLLLCCTCSGGVLVSNHSMALYLRGSDYALMLLLSVENLFFSMVRMFCGRSEHF